MKQLLIILLATATTSGLPHHGRIFGGTPAASGQFPFIASLNNPDQLCDASIINKNWLLTAAHCIDLVTNTTQVLVGTNFQHSGGTKYNISKAIAHEGFSYNTLKNDIALIKIYGEFQFDNLVQPVEFVDPGVNQTCIAAGWGVTESVSFPEELHFVEQIALDLELCQVIIEDTESFLGSEQVCGFGVEGTGACFGDSGGPLVCDGRLGGVMSFVFGGCEQNYPDVYTRPLDFADWISENMK